MGGKLLSNKKGNLVDFLAKASITDALTLIEIKTPSTKLLGKEYRAGVFPFSSDLVGAVAQVLHYRQQLMRNFANLTNSEQHRIVLGDPRCIVIAGCAGEELATEKRRDSFELQRHRLEGVTIVAFDELFERVSQSIDLLEA